MLRKSIIILILLAIPYASSASETLHLVTSLDPIEAGEYIKEFEKDTGVDVEWIRLSAGEVVARLKAEGTNQTQSVWFGGPIPEYVAAKNAGLLKPYQPKDASKIPSKWRDKNDFYTGIYLGSIVFISNEKYLADNNIKPPESWNDLLNREWKGRVTIAYPYTAGTGFTILAGLITLMGEDQAYEYWKKLDPSIHHYTKSGARPIIDVGLGESAVGVVFAQDAIRKGVFRGFPLKISFPREGTPFEVGGVALLNNAPEDKEAKAFIDWIVSKKGQNQFHKWGRVPINPDAKLPEELKSLKDIKLVEMDMIKMGEERAKYVKRWREEMKQ